MALGACGRHLRAQLNRPQRQKGSAGCLWPQPPAHPASPPAHASSPCQSLRVLSEDSGRWLLLFQFGEEQSVNISFEYIQIRPCAGGL